MNENRDVLKRFTTRTSSRMNSISNESDSINGRQCYRHPLHVLVYLVGRRLIFTGHPRCDLIW
jgi:hypothetical protein